jgi:AcrR family transcriptional regulator
MAGAAEHLEVALPAPATVKGAAMRDRLLSAAATVFARKGYELTRVEDIAKAAKTSYGNFYRHFRNKDELLIAVLRPLLDEIYGASRRRGGGALQPSEAEFVQITVDYLQTYAKHRKLFRVMREAAARGDEASFFSLWIEERSRFTKRSTAWLTLLKTKGLIAEDLDPDMLAETLGAMTEQVAYMKIGLAREKPSDAEIRRIGSHCAKIWRRGVFGSVE